jgi:hypothetical protein
MDRLIDAFWRAAAYCLHPKVIALSLVPLLLMAALAFGLGWFFWAPAVDGVRSALESWWPTSMAFNWLDGHELTPLKLLVAPLVVVLLALPAIVVLALLVVAALMMPAMVKLVGERRFRHLERKHGGSFIGGALGAVGATLVALLALILSLPLWFVPPLALVLPPLIWGWLTYRVLSYDALVEHASAAERQLLIREHRAPLLAIGVVTGYLGAAPSLLWAFGALSVALAPVLVPLAIWIYTLVFAFASLWFAHFLLAALEAHRAAPPPAPPTTTLLPGESLEGP